MVRSSISMAANLLPAEGQSGQAQQAVLICTEDPELYMLLDHILQVAGYRCLLADNDSEAEAGLGGTRPLAVVIDSQTWRGDTAALCDRAKKSGCAVCALIAAGMQSTHLEMIKAGIDDGIVRPLAPARLIDFLHLTAGRARELPTSRGRHDRSDARHVVIGGTRLRVTAVEARIFKALLRSHGIACSRQAILSAVWSAADRVKPRTIDVHIARLRKTLSACTGARIETVHGKGYALVLA